MKGSADKKKPDDVGTWTIRPDDDVRECVGAFLKNNSHYDRTKIINEALRLRLPEAVESLLRRQKAEIEAKLVELKRRKPFNSLKNAQKEVLSSVLTRVGELAPKGKHQ